jgi:hypothetical protein
MKKQDNFGQILAFNSLAAMANKSRCFLRSFFKGIPTNAQVQVRVSIYTVKKKVREFPVPSRDVTTNQTLPGRE